MIAHNRPTLGDAEAAAAAEAVRSGYVARGPQVRMFEDELCEWLGLPSGCAALTSSGTAALFLALEACGARSQSVCVPAYACSALRNAVAMAGADAQFVDCAPGSANADPAAILHSSSAIAIVPHMYGLPADSTHLAQVKTLIDDAAQSIGARIDGVPAGRLGRVGIFSFYATKLLTTGGNGGAVVSSDPALIAHVHDYLDFDCRRDDRPRFNFQIGDVQAAVGRVQLKRLHAFLERRSEIFAMYAAGGADLLGKSVPDGVEPVRYRAILRTQKPQSVIDRLADHGITAIVPTHDWELAPGAFPNALELTHATVSLPIYPSLTDAEVQSIVRVLGTAA